MSRARAYVVVTNNYTFDNILEFVELSAQYIVFGFEVGKNGTPHIQGYVYLYDAKTKRALSKHFPRSHLEVAKGSPEQNFKYDSKDGEFYEFGIPPSQGRATFDRVAEAMLNPRDDFHIFHQYRKAYAEFINSQSKDHTRLAYAMTHDCIHPFLDQLPEHLTVCMDSTNYDGEDVMIVRYVPDFIEMDDWRLGRPHKRKYGYENRPLDPTIRMIIYDKEFTRKDIKEHAPYAIFFELGDKI